MGIANRLHLDVDDAVWRRFPMACSYCGKRPCACKAIKPKQRARLSRKDSLKPSTLRAFQEMFAAIYPPSSRTLAGAGVHLAEEVGEVNEAVHIFLGEHKNTQFTDLTNEIADCVSCIFGVANSADIDVARGLADMYRNNCHSCHKAPCVCSFSFIAKFVS